MTLIKKLLLSGGVIFLNSGLVLSQVEKPSIFITEENSNRDIIWVGLAGSFYSVEYSTDLSIWNQSDLSRIGNDGIERANINAIFPSTPPEKGFVRVIRHLPGSTLDSDADGIPNWWEIKFSTGYNINNPDANNDGDLFTNLAEFTNGTNPLEADTDGDGSPDHLDSSPTDPSSGGDPNSGTLDLRVFTTTFLGPSYPPNEEPFYDVKIFQFDSTNSNETLVRNIAYDGDNGFTNESFSLPRDGSIYSLQMDLPVFTDTPEGDDFRDFEFFTAVRMASGQTKFSGWHVADGYDIPNSTFTPGRILLEGRNQYSLNFREPRALIFPIEIKDAEPESGVDNIIERFDSTNDLTAPWVMVPAGAETNSFVIEGFQQFEQPLSISSNTLSISPTMTGASNSVEVTVSGTSSIGDTEIIEVGNSGRNTTIARLAVYDRKDFSVAIHKINFPTNSGVIEPQNVPTAAELESYLNAVFGKQANVFFSVTETAPLTVDFDIGGAPQTFPQLSQRVIANNDFFDAVIADNGRSGEEDLILDQRLDSSADINVFFLPLSARLHGLITISIVDGTPLFSTVSPVALAKEERDINTGEITNRIAYIRSTGDISEFITMNTVAHEIGHFTLPGNDENLDHPREPSDGPPSGDPNAFTLKNSSNDLKRLMRGDVDIQNLQNEINPETGLPFALLLKDEWDVLQGATE